MNIEQVPKPCDAIPNYLFIYIGVCLTAHTPNIYGNWFATNNGTGAGLIINFLNPNDFALRRSAWQLDQLTRPDQRVVQSDGTWNYAYNGSTSDPPPRNHFSKSYVYYVSTNAFTNTVSFDIAATLTNRYEVMAFAAQSWTTALGATPGVHNVANNVDLTSQDNQIWPPDPNNYAAHFWHSGEFRGPYWQQQGYWQALLSRQNGFNLRRP